jgi:peptidoglycan/xylan/chitin deacetylase (PgdA/CDA1 family)
MNTGQAWKNLLLTHCCKLGLFELGHVVCRNKLLIVCYHRFASSARGDGAICARLFETHLRYLKRRFTITSFAKLGEMLRAKVPVWNPLILTIDDGHADFMEIAVPLLARHGVPATVFVTTRFVDGEIWLWPDILHYALLKTGETRLLLRRCETELPLDTQPEKMQALDRVLGICKALMDDEKTEFMKDVIEQLNVRIPPTPPREFESVSWDALRSLDSTLIEVGAHTLTHPILSKISRKQAEEEIAQSKVRIEGMLDRQVIAFAYPNGLVGDYGEREKKLLKKHGYRFAVTCNGGFNTLDQDPFELMRVPVQYDIPHFIQEVSGFEGLKRRVRARSASFEPRSAM